MSSKRIGELIHPNIERGSKSSKVGNKERYEGYHKVRREREEEGFKTVIFSIEKTLTA